MLNKLPEKQMHLIKYLLALGWLTLICSLFYDPISPLLTDPANLSSPFRLPPIDQLIDQSVPSLGVDWQSFQRFTADPNICVQIQGKCIPEQPYGMGARIFWAMIVPIGLVIIHIFGHELWRRICPLSFFSQIPRALGIQRKRKVKTESGRGRTELVIVDKDSWLGRNYLYLQFGLFFIGLNLRILFVNSDRLALGLFLLFTIGAAITVGYLYAGKSWCQYFCPMAPVQMVYTGPRGLLDSHAHLGQQRLGITQSMCREVDKSGQEKSACVSCQSPCIDIDSERTYWEKITSHDQKLLYYGYVGLVISFYFYYYLYSGNWKYYYSGAWTHEETQISTLFSPGFYINGQALPIPKLIACPLTLGVFCLGTYLIGELVERCYKFYLRKAGKQLSLSQIRHNMFTLSTVVAWNIFWTFGSRPNLALLPPVIERLITGFLVICSGLWLYQTWGRSEEQYQRESVANKLRRQLDKLGINIANFLNRQVDELKPDEVFVLAKVIPAVDKEQRLNAYRGVLQETLEEGRINSANSLALLEDLRQELGIDSNEHYVLLNEIGIEDPSLLDPHRQSGIETQIRLDSYFRNIEFLIMDVVEGGLPVREAIRSKAKQISALKEEYRITESEDKEVLAKLLGQESTLVKTASNIIEQYIDFGVFDQALRNLPSNKGELIYRFLQLLNYDRAKNLLSKFLSILEVLGSSETAIDLAGRLTNWAPQLMDQLLNSPEVEIPWRDRIDNKILSQLQKTDSSIASILGVAGEGSPKTLINLNPLVETRVSEKTLVGTTDRESALVPILLQTLKENNPVLQAGILYALNSLDKRAAQEGAKELVTMGYQFPILREVIALVMETKSPKAFSANQRQVVVKLRNKGELTTLSFNKPIISIGSAADNDIVIGDSRIADHHASLSATDYGLSIRHSGKAAAIYIGDREVYNAREYFQPTDLLRLTIGEEITLEVSLTNEQPQDDTRETILEKLLYLSQSSLFQAIPVASLLQIAEKSSVQLFNPNAVICHQGQPVHQIRIVISGEADVLVPSRGIIGKVNEGETIGELGGLTNLPSSASVIAKTTVKVLSVEAKELRQMINCDSKLASEMLIMVSRRLQSTLEKINSNA